MNFEKFKEKFVNFIMKKWTCPTVCGVCILLIFAMSANSFAKYYTRIQEERAASVAVFGTNLRNDEDLWTRPNITEDGFQGSKTATKVEPIASKNNLSAGCVRIFMGSNTTIDDKAVLPYSTNRDYQFSITNSANGKICEVALQYTITIEFPDVMPNGITWSLKNSSGTVINGADLPESEFTNSYTVMGKTFSHSSFTFAPGVAETDTYTIVFSDGGKVNYESVDKFYDDMRITVVTTQITK